jgi:hypothetical protein
MMGGVAIENRGHGKMLSVPQNVIAPALKIGGLDDPSRYDRPQMALFTIDQQPFHPVSDGLAQFLRLP